MSYNDKFRRLSERRRLYTKYNRLTTITLYVMIGFFYGGLFIITNLTTDFLATWYFGEIRLNISGIIFLIIVIPSFITLNKFSKKREYYSLTLEEWLFLDVYSIYENLDYYLKEKKEINRMEAVKTLEHALKRISEKWKYGHLELVKNLVGIQIDFFKRNLKEKLLPAIERGDEAILKNSCNVLYNLIMFLNQQKPPVDQLEQINLGMSKLSTITSEKQSVVKRLLFNPRIQHFLAILACVTGGILSYCIGIYYIGVSKETAYIVSFSFAGVLLLAYVEIIRRR